MEIIEWIRFILGAIFMVCGLIVFVVEMIGVFKFKYVLNRMHAAAITYLKLFLIIVFLWIASPVSSHLIARLEVTTNEDRAHHYTEKKLGALEEGE